jgi:hypothetical protein
MPPRRHFQPVPRKARRQLRLDPCGLLAKRDRERLSVQVVSVVEVGPGGAAGTRIRLPAQKGGPKVIWGTEVDVDAIGTPTS